jgi:myo-inositol-1(or 4)-monophosphatase
MMLSLEFASEVVKIARKVGKYQMANFRKLESYSEKGRNDLVTEVDRESELILYKELKVLGEERGQNISFLGEEFGDQNSGQDWSWIVDPIDGTTNFVYGLDLFSISIGLCFQSLPKLGVVYRPYTDDVYMAVEGLGGYLNERRLPPLKAIDISQCLIGTGFPFRSKELYSAFFAASEAVLSVSRDMRRCGSAALDLCFLASGVFQGFWECDLKPYDVAGSIPILNEVGAEIWDLHGRPYQLGKGRFFVAGNTSILQDLYRATATPYLKVLKS